MVVGGQKESAARPVFIVCFDDPVERDGLAQPSRVPRRFEEVEEPRRQKRVVVEVGVMLGAAVLEAAVQPLALAELLQQESCCLFRALRVPLVAERQGRPRVSGDHQAVPGRQDLLVAQRRRTLLARFVEDLLRLLDRRPDLFLRHAERLCDFGEGLWSVEDVSAFKVSLWRRAEPCLGDPGAARVHDLADLLRRPCEEPALLPPAGRSGTVGVGRGIEGPLGRGHVALGIQQDLPDDVRVTFLSRRLVALEVSHRQEGVVVEHLLEVRHEPVRVRRVPVEAAPDLVVHAPGRHPVERQRDHSEKVLLAGPAIEMEEEPNRQRTRELHAGLQPSPFPVEASSVVVGGPREGRGIRTPLRGDLRHVLLDPAGDLLGRLGDAIRLGVIGLAKLSEKVQELGRGKVRAAEEGRSVGRGGHRHRPAAAAGQHLDRVHVDGVHIRPLFPVHLDRHIVLVHEPRDLFVFEGLLLHHVAPVAGGVADGEKDRTTKPPGGGERLVAPGVPVHRVVRVLLQIRARLEVETVGVLRRAIRVEMPRAGFLAGRPGGPGGLKLPHECVVERGRSGQGTAEAPAGPGRVATCHARSRCRRAGNGGRRSSFLTKVCGRREQASQRQKYDRAVPDQSGAPSSVYAAGFFFHVPFSSNQV